jgi:hypothetical protein
VTEMIEAPAGLEGVPAFNTQIAGPEHGMNIAQKREGRLIRPTARYIGPGPRLADSVTGAAPA